MLTIKGNTKMNPKTFELSLEPSEIGVDLVVEVNGVKHTVEEFKEINGKLSVVREAGLPTKDFHVDHNGQITYRS